jgi:hypothetical protein
MYAAIATPVLILLRRATPYNSAKVISRYMPDISHTCPAKLRDA